MAWFKGTYYEPWDSALSGWFDSPEGQQQFPDVPPGDFTDGGQSWGWHHTSGWAFGWYFDWGGGALLSPGVWGADWGWNFGWTWNPETGWVLGWSWATGWEFGWHLTTGWENGFYWDWSNWSFGWVDTAGPWVHTIFFAPWDSAFEPDWGDPPANSFFTSGDETGWHHTTGWAFGWYYDWADSASWWNVDIWGFTYFVEHVGDFGWHFGWTFNPTSGWELGWTWYTGWEFGWHHTFGWATGDFTDWSQWAWGWVAHSLNI